MTNRLDARVWVVWLVASVTAVLLTRNPLYAVILLLVAQIVRTTCVANPDAVNLSLWRIGVFTLLFSMLFNGLSVHIGQTVLLTLPVDWPLIGGNLTLEAMIYGAISGLVLLTMLALFLAFNTAVATGDLVRLTPRAFHHLGLVVLIAMSYVPETLRQLQRIREAQAVRGHRLQGVGDWRPIVIPLLIGGLERSMNLAEAMVARGFGATEEVRANWTAQLGLVLALLLVVGGWMLTFWQTTAGWLLLAAGVGLLLVLIWRQGHGREHTRYRPRRWTGWDTVVLVTAVVPLLLVLVNVPGVDRSSLSYEPYPALTLPPFDPVLGLALLLLVTPAAAEILNHEA